MKITKICLLTVVFLFLQNLKAAESPAGWYVGFDLNSGNVAERVYFVEVTGPLVNLILVDYIADRMELASLTLSGGTASGVTLQGRGITVDSIDPQKSLRLTLAGSIKTIPFVPPPVTGAQTTYTGTVFIPGGDESPVTRFTFVDERAIMFWITESGFINGGYGALENGQVKLSLVNDLFVEFPFIEQNGAAVGRATFQNSTTRAFDFLLVKRAAPSFANISTRGWIGAGQNMIAGTVISDGPKRLLIRAVGPTLGAFGVPTAHPNPRIKLFQGTTLLDSNDDWSGSEISETAAYVGAFALEVGSKDASLLITLDQGAYTVIVEGDGAPGEAIVEVYEVK